MALIFLAYPLAVYVSLCLLPPARAGIGIALALAALAVVWLTSDPAADEGFSRLMVMLGAAPVALAALAQGLRRLLPVGAGRWVWPALAAGLAMSALALFMMLL